MVQDVDEIEGFGPLPSEPKRGGPKKAAAPKPSGGTSQKSLANDIATVLITANLVLSPVLKQDGMDDVEIMALAKAMDEQAKKSPRFRKALIRALEATGGAGLFTIVAVIIGRRASRHGIVPKEWDEKLGAYLAFTQMTPSQAMMHMEDVIAKAMAEAASGNDNSDTGATPESGPIATETPRPN